VNVKKEEVQIQKGSEEVQYIPVSCITEATHAKRKDWDKEYVPRLIQDYTLTKDNFKIWLEYTTGLDLDSSLYLRHSLSDWEFFKKEVQVQKPITQTKVIIEMDEDSAVVLRDILGKFGFDNNKDVYPVLSTVNKINDSETLYAQLYTLLIKNRSQIEFRLSGSPKAPNLVRF
jgi:hypothetical protein